MRENMTSLGYYIFRNYDILTLLQLLGLLVQNPSHSRAFRDGRFYPGRINLAGLFDW